MSLDRNAALLCAVLLAGCGSEPAPVSTTRSEAPPRCERWLRCNAPVCSCPDGYRCVVVGPELADCVE